MTRVSRVLVLICYVAVPLTCKGNDANKASAARQVVEQFCQAELQGDDIRLRKELIMLSPKRRTELDKLNGPIAPIVLDVSTDSLYVVGSCQVREVKCGKASGKANVAYKRLARQYESREPLPNKKARGYLPRIVPDYKENDVVELKLVKKNNRWWVLDPPLARVSKDVLIRNYESSTICHDRDWLEQATNVQQEVCREQQQNLKVLKNLPN